jgi:hypothetical protein
VPPGWEVADDAPRSFAVHHLPDAAQGLPSRELVISVLAQPSMTADFAAGADCNTVLDAPGVGPGRDGLVAAIRARPGVVSTPPVNVTVGGFSGLMLDLRLAPAWTGGCMSLGGPLIGAPILHGPGPTGAVVGVSEDAPVRLILVDLGDGQTLAVVVFGIKPTASASFEDQAAAAMPIIDSFMIGPSTPSASPTLTP